MERKRQPIPPPPSPDAEILTPAETCGLLRIRERRLEDLRKEDMDFPKPHILGGQLRWRRSDLVAWFEGLKRGWAERGSRAKGATC